MISRVQEERGAVAVLIAIMLPLLLAVGGFGLGALLVAGGEREVQRATDAAALGAASTLPLADLTASTRAGATQAACALAADNLAAATIASGFATGELPSCEQGTVTVEYHDELADVRAFQDTINGLPSQLPGLNVSVSTTVTICTQVTLLGQNVTACTDVTVTSDDAGGTVCAPTNVVVLGVTFTVNVCGQVTPPDPIQLPMPVNLSDVAPALLTPRVSVTARHTVTSPLGELIGTGRGTNEVTARSVARRRLKNAVLLPITECEGIEADLQAPGVDFRASLEARCSLDANPYADWAGQGTFAALDGVGAELATLVPGQGEVAGCLLEAFKQDLQDLYDPPGAGSAPTSNAIIRSAAAADEDVLVVVAGSLAGLAVPVLDLFAVPGQDLSNGDLSNAVAWTEARGVFRATLIEQGSPDRAVGCLGL